MLHSRPDDQELLLVYARALSQKGRPAEASDAATELVSTLRRALDTI